ncbi:hypothetical protein FB639_001177 [Coemansia asiatica]|nr:hypothetical protein FB639_001177 [Coemansia asiatica]
MTTLRRILRIRNHTGSAETSPMTDEARMSLALAIAEHYLLVAGEFPMMDTADSMAGSSPISCKSTLSESHRCTKYSWWSRFSVSSSSTSSTVSTINHDIYMVAAKEHPLVSVFQQ